MQQQRAVVVAMAVPTLTSLEGNVQGGDQVMGPCPWAGSGRMSRGRCSQVFLQEAGSSNGHPKGKDPLSLLGRPQTCLWPEARPAHPSSLSPFTGSELWSEAPSHTSPSPCVSHQGPSPK